MRTSMVSGAIIAMALALSIRAAPRVDDVAKILADARQALGGAQRLSAILTFTAKGKIAIGSAPEQQYGSFEISCQLPDKFVWLEDISFVDTRAEGGFGDAYFGSDRTAARVGFNGDTLIYQPSLTGSNRYATTVGRATSSPPPAPTQAQLQSWLPYAKQDFVRVTLGIFATSFSGAPLLFTETRETGSGTSVAISGDSRGTLFFDPATHLPARLDGFVYADYRGVDGVNVPFRLVGRHAPGGPSGGPWPRGLSAVEEWDVQEFRFNVPISPKVFRPAGQ